MRPRFNGRLRGMISLNHMKKYILHIFILVGLIMFSTPVSAAGSCSGGNFDSQTLCEMYGYVWSANSNLCADLAGIGKVICQINGILNSIIPVLMTLGVLYFVWGVVHYFIAGGDEAKKKGRDQIVYGIIGLAVITGVWGLVNILTRTFGLNGSAPNLVAFTPPSGNTCSLVGNPKFQDVLCYITNIINDSVIPLIFTFAVVVFIWGVVQFVINSSEEAKKEKGRQFMLWGIIALAVMVSVWGLVGILTATFGIDGSILPQVKP